MLSEWILLPIDRSDLSRWHCHRLAVHGKGSQEILMKSSNWWREHSCTIDVWVLKFVHIVKMQSKVSRHLIMNEPTEKNNWFSDTTSIFNITRFAIVSYSQKSYRIWLLSNVGSAIEQVNNHTVLTYFFFWNPIRNANENNLPEYGTCVI